MTAESFIPEKYPALPKSGIVSWQAPSNIALVKYWGKYPVQIPANPSLSLTLDTCATTTKVKFDKLRSKVPGYSFKILLDEKENTAFRPKIETFLERINLYVPFLKDYDLTIHTSNSFPHSSGIASSASGMAALALCIADMERMITGDMANDHFLTKASFLARLGSGSAARSISGPAMQWGKHPDFPESTDLYAIPWEDGIHEVFNDYCDTILLIHHGAKKVSSTAGHDLMTGHPFSKARFHQAELNMGRLKDILFKGDLDGFVEIVEEEALSLHAMMLTSRPSFILMQPNTLAVINKIRELRKDTGLPVCFTLDAGANVHLLYPENVKKEITQFIKNELVVYCERGDYICDRVGKGAKKLV